jgi:glycerol-3-phosphate cytidylyltransferase
MTNILTYGTFDLFHYGHVNILSRARSLGDKLFVGVSTDEFNFVKGKVSCDDLAARMCNVSRQVPDAHVFQEANFEQKVADIIQFKIDVFVMGDDWNGKFDWLKDYCRVLYLPRTPGISTTMLKSLAAVPAMVHSHSNR